MEENCPKISKISVNSHVIPAMHHQKCENVVIRLNVVDLPNLRKTISLIMDLLESGFEIVDIGGDSDNSKIVLARNHYYFKRGILETHQLFTK